MKFLRVPCLLIIVALCLLDTARAADDPTGSLPGIRDLDSKNFDKIVNGRKHALVEFYAPWCGHCKKIVPEYKLLGAKVAADPELKDRVVVAKVNADDQKEVGKRFGIQGFPTIKWFGRGNSVEAPDDYEGSRTMEGFIKFIKRKLKEDKGFAQLEVMSEIAKGFSESDDKDALIDEAEEKLNDLSGEQKSNGELYVKAMRKAMEKGTDYFQKEHGRITRILNTGNVAQDKADELSRKASVLSAFFEA